MTAAQMNHLVVHWLDLLRHWGASIFQPFSWGPNLSAWIICGAIAGAGSYVVWPRVRRAVNRWLAGHLSGHTDALKAHVEAATAEIRAHYEAANSELHSKLDRLLHVANAAGPSAQIPPTTKETPVSLATEVLDDIANRFRHHAPSSQAVADTHGAVRALLEETAKQLLELTPAGREASLVLTKLEEVGFWAHAAIARNQPAAAATATAGSEAVAAVTATDTPAPAATAEPTSDTPAPAA